VKLISWAALESEAVWLLQNYEVVPLNPALSNRIGEIARALKHGAPVSPDPKRAAFCDMELENGRAYIHVRDAARTVYVVAVTGS
jgi:hypothetical protein